MIAVGARLVAIRPVSASQKKLRRFLKADSTDGFRGSGNEGNALMSVAANTIARRGANIGSIGPLFSVPNARATPHTRVARLNLPVSLSGQLSCAVFGHVHILTNITIAVRNTEKTPNTVCDSKIDIGSSCQHFAYQSRNGLCLCRHITNDYVAFWRNRQDRL